MGLDAHVMPISGFAVGDYDSPLLKFAEQTGTPVTVVGPDGTRRIGPPKGMLGRVARWTRWYSLTKAYQSWRRRRMRDRGLQLVRYLREQLLQEFGVRATWNEEGPAIQTHQLWRHALHGLRTAAIRAEFPAELSDLPPVKDEEGRNLDETDRIYRRRHELGLKPLRFPHLCDFSDIDGYYVPTGFVRPLWVHDVRKEDHPWFRGRPEWQRTPIGSSSVLLRELDELNEVLQVARRWDQLKSGEGEPNDFMGNARTGWMLLEWFARRSLEADTPICFDG